MVELIVANRPEPREAPEDLVPKPQGDFVLLEREPTPKTESGIELASDDSTQSYHKVIAVGPGSYQNGVFVPTTVVVGKRYLVNAPAGEAGNFWWGGKRYGLTRECWLCCELPGEKPTPFPKASSMIRPATMSELGALQ